VTVVLLPGIGGSAAHDFGFLRPMLERRHDVLALDLPCASFDELVTGVVGRLPGSGVTLVGCSIGAAVALAVAARVRVDSLVLVSGTCTAGPRQRAFAASWAASSARADLARFAALGTRADESLVPFPVGSATDAHVELLASLDLAAAAAAVTAPTLLVAGHDDAITGRDQSAALLGAIDDARYAELDCGHAVLLERPAQLLALVEQFVAEPGRYPAGSTVPRVSP
jgi:pimeloyl-ACP methyl ester carboxylesterase